MIIYYILIMALALFGIKFISSQNEQQLNRALERDCTDAIKGIFILIVFSRHIFPYIASQVEEFNYFDRLFITADGMVRQLLVVIFLFYSGYGVAESIGKKGDKYLNSIPYNRIMVTLLNFSVAVGFFIILGLILGNDISFSKGLLSLVGWESVGNSNWYIFCILVMYAATFLSFKLFKKRIHIMSSMALLLTLYIAIVQHFRGVLG